MVTDTKYNCSVASRWHAGPGFGKSKILALMPKCCRGRMMSAACARTMALLLLLAGLVQPAVAEEKDCVLEEEMQSYDEALDGFRDWLSLYQSYVRYSHCIDASISSAYTEATYELLIEHWPTLDKFHKLGDVDQEFRDWVIKDVISGSGAELFWHESKTVYGNARDKCPEGLDSLCREIMEQQLVSYAASKTWYATSDDAYWKSNPPDRALTLLEAAVTRDGSCSHTARWLSGSQGNECPVSVLDKLSVLRDGDVVDVPAIAYNDLGNPYAASVEEGDGDAYRVVIETATFEPNSSYHVIIGFKGETLVDRVVKRGHDGHSRNTADGGTEYAFDAETGEYGVRCSDDGYREISASGGMVEAVAAVSLNSTGNCNPASGFEGWGVEDFCPEGQVERLVVTHAGKEVHVPVSAYNDLHDVGDVSVASDGSADGYEVHIDGGQAAHAYLAKLRFEGDSIIGRTVTPQPGSSRGGLRETTEYGRGDN